MNKIGCIGGLITSNQLVCLRQSLAVQQAAYESRWYNSSRRFKKHIIYLVMRSQKPVRLTAGKFFAVSLEGFSEVLCVLI